MAYPRQIITNPSSSVPTEGEARGRKLRLKAANDNRRPLLEQIKHLLFYATPLAAGMFLIAVWLFS